MISVWYISKCSLLSKFSFFMHYCPDFEIFMTIILYSLLGKSLISFSLDLVSNDFFCSCVWSIFPYFFIFFDFFVDICTLNKKAAYFILIDWPHKETNLISQPGLSTQLSFKCLCPGCHCFPSGSQYLRV